MRSEQTPTSHFLHEKGMKNSRGLSPVISTLVISGVLLIILVIASFVSTNILELQIASTEFEQAKTNMMLLDDVVQDVALRLGSGGYVQFNQRSGGIGVAETAEMITVVGPSHQVNITKSPTLTSPSSGGWNDPAFAYSESDDFAFVDSGNPSASQTYFGYGFSVPSSPLTSITKVMVRIDARAEENAFIELQVSPDNGSTWLPATPLRHTWGARKETWIFDVTSYVNAPGALNQIQTRVTALTDKKATRVYLFWIAVEVMYVTDVIYASQPQVNLIYRGGSRVSAADLIIRGDGSLNVSLTEPLGYLRVELNEGVEIRLDYHRVRIVELETLLVGNEYANFVEMAFVRLSRGNMGGSGAISVKVQNRGMQTFSHVFNSASLLIEARFGTKTTGPICLDDLDPRATRTVVMFTEISVQVSTA